MRNFQKRCKKPKFVYIISLMDNLILEKIAPYVSLGLLIIFLLFVGLGMLFGLFRGVKRASLRLVILFSLLIAAFFATPFIANAFLNLDINIAGQTPRQVVDNMSERIMQAMQTQFGDYIVPFQDYIQEYALGIVFAIMNLVLFLGLYVIIRISSWTIYAIIARFVAPKCDRDGNKNPKHAGLGLLVGAVQGVFLFVIFMFPINGAIGVVNQAAAYYTAQTQNETQITTQANSYGYSDSNDFNFGGIDIDAVLTKVERPLAMYQNFMTYSGLQFLSNKALEYQLTIRVKDADDINLVHDVNSGFELFIDSKDFMKTMTKLKDAYYDGKVDLTVLSADDYAVMRQFINKAFDLQIFNVANNLLNDLDQILSTPFNDDQTKLDGTDIYANSIYGKLIQQNTTTRNFDYELGIDEVAPTNYAQFASGLQTAVNYIGEQKLELIRKDLINMIDFAEALNVYQVTYDGLTGSKTLAEILAQGNLGVKGYLDLTTARLVKTYEPYKQNTPLINVLGDRLTKFSIVQLIGLEHVDNLLMYSKQMDSVAADDEDLKTLVNGLIPLFIGKNALTHGGVKGNWEILGNDIIGTAHVIRDYVTIFDDINQEKERIIAEDTSSLTEQEKASKAQMQAIINYLSNMITDGENKYEKIDELIGAVYPLINDFKPVKTFIKSKLANMEGEYTETLISMIDKNEEEWKETLHTIVDVADIMKNSKLGELITDVQNTTPEDLVDKFVEAVQNMDADDVADMLTGIMDIPQVNEIVKENLGKLLDEVSAESTEELQSVLPEGTDAAEVQAQLEELKNQIDKYGTPDADEDALKDAVAALWDLINPQSTGD